MKTVVAAPAVYSPCPPQEALPLKKNAVAGFVVQRAKKSSVSEEQLTTAQHNWINVIAKYGDGRQEVEGWAFDFGYNTETAGDAIIQAIESTKWKSKKIAHSLGTDGSGVRAGTLEAIKECKRAIHEWLEANPGPGYKAQKKKKKGGRNRNDEDD